MLEVRERRYEFYGANFSVKRELLLQHGGFSESLGRTANHLYIGEELQLFLKLLDARCRIVYDPEILVHHVIAEKRKTKSYLQKYYRDIAHSLVVLADRDEDIGRGRRAELVAGLLDRQRRVVRRESRPREGEADEAGTHQQCQAE